MKDKENIDNNVMMEIIDDALEIFELDIHKDFAFNIVTNIFNNKDLTFKEVEEFINLFKNFLNYILWRLREEKK